MKKRMKLTACLMSAALLGSTVLPASAEQETPSMDPVLTEFCERIASWENVTLNDCTVLTRGDSVQVLTPDKPYTVEKLRYSRYRVWLTDGAAPDTDAVLKKWKEMLAAEDYPAEKTEHFSCSVKPANGGYDIFISQEEYKALSVADCLKTFPEVLKIDAQFGYRTDDRVNRMSDTRLLVECDAEPKPEDFPEADIRSIVPTNDPAYPGWLLSPGAGTYEDCVSAAKGLQRTGKVPNLWLWYGSTDVMDSRPDAELMMPERETLYLRAGAESLPEKQEITAYELARQIQHGYYTVWDEKGVTEYMEPHLAFYWKGDGTPENAVIGGQKLTPITDRGIFREPYETQSILTAAEMLSHWEGYEGTTYIVPDELKQSGIWIVSGAEQPEFAEALLADDRIEICGVLSVTEQRDYEWDEWDGELYRVLPDGMECLHYSLELMPLIQYGDADCDGRITLLDAIDVLKQYNAAVLLDEYGFMTAKQIAAADVDLDRKVTAKDAAYIQQYINFADILEEPKTWEEIIGK